MRRAVGFAVAGARRRPSWPAPMFWRSKFTTSIRAVRTSPWDPKRSSHWSSRPSLPSRKVFVIPGLCDLALNGTGNRPAARGCPLPEAVWEDVPGSAGRSSVSAGHRDPWFLPAPSAESGRDSLGPSTRRRPSRPAGRNRRMRIRIAKAMAPERGRTGAGHQRLDQPDQHAAQAAAPGRLPMPPRDRRDERFQSRQGAHKGRCLDNSSRTDSSRVCERGAEGRINEMTRRC